MEDEKGAQDGVSSSYGQGREDELNDSIYDDTQSEWVEWVPPSIDPLAPNGTGPLHSRTFSTCEPDVITTSSDPNDTSTRQRTNSMDEPDIIIEEGEGGTAESPDPLSLAFIKEDRDLHYITLEYIFQLIKDSNTNETEVLELLQTNSDITFILYKRSTRSVIQDHMETLLLRNWIQVQEHIMHCHDNPDESNLIHRELELALLCDECMLASSIMSQLSISDLLNLMNVNTPLNSGNTLLHLAAMFRKDDIFCELLSYRASTVVANKDGNTPLHFVCTSCSMATIDKALEVTKNCNAQNKYGETALHCMIKSQNFAEMSYQFLSKFDLELQDKDGDTVLHLAGKGNSELPVRLLAVDTRTVTCMLTRNLRGDCFLDLLIKRCFEQPQGAFANSFELLLQKHESFDWSPKVEDVEIIHRMMKGPDSCSERFLLSLIKHPKIAQTCFTRNENDLSLYEALLLSCLQEPLPSVCVVLKGFLQQPQSNYWFEGNERVARILLNALLDENHSLFMTFIVQPFCDLTVKLNGFKDTILHLVCSKKTIQYDSLSCLFSHQSADLNITNIHGDTPIHIACRHGNFKLISTIASCGKQMDLSLTNNNGNTPLMELLKRHKEHGNVETLDELVGIFTEIHSGDNMLHVATRMRYSLEFSLDILTPTEESVLKKSYHSLNSEGHTPLYVAMVTQQFRKAEILLSAYNPQGYSLLQYSCLSSDLTHSLSALLKIPKYHGTLQQRDKKGNTALHIAALSQHNSTLAVKLLTDCDPRQGKVKNHSGETPLHIACRSKHTQIIETLLKAYPEAINIRDDDDYLPLHSACQLGDAETVKSLLALDSDPVTSLGTKNRDGNTPIHLISKESASLLKYVLSKYKLEKLFTTKDGQGNTPFHLILKLHSNQEVVYALRTVFKHIREVPLIYNRSGNTVYHDCIKDMYDEPLKVLLENISNRLTCENIVELVRCAIQTDPPCLSKIDLLLNYHQTEHPGGTKCDFISSPGEGLSLLHYTAMIDCERLAIRLVEDFKADPCCVGLHGNTPLHTACLSGSLNVAKYLLSTTKCDINLCNTFGQSPLEIVKTSIPMLTLFNKFQDLSDCVNQYAIDSYCKVFVTGNTGAGKTTVIEVFKNFVNSKGAVTKLVSKLRKISDVEKLTAGIIPSIFCGEGVGNLVIYDLAGHFEFHSSHSAVLKHLISSSCPLFVLLVNLSESYENVQDSLHYWLNLLHYESSQRLTSVSPVIVIGSHDDIASKSDRYSEKKALVSSIFTDDNYSSLRLAGFVAMNCQKRASPGLEMFQKISISEFKQLRSLAPKVSVICHGLYAYLTTITSSLSQEELALTLGDLQKRLQDSETDFLPKDCTSLSELLETLGDRGLILFLKNSNELSKSWIIVQKEELLSQINGVIFAPQSFRSHITTISNTGLVSMSCLENLFPLYPVDILVKFLVHFELCQELERSIFVDNNLLESKNETLPKKLLFFPSLIHDVISEGYWPPERTTGQSHFWFNWVLQCSSSTRQFFTVRFLHVLLLRLAFEFAFKPSKDKETITSSTNASSSSTSAPHINPNITRKCSIWKTGIRWLTNDGTGIWTMVHLTNNNRTLSMLMASPKDDSDLPPNYISIVRYRTKVMSTILKTRDDFCKDLDLQEVFQHPSRSLLPADDRFRLPSSEKREHIYGLVDIRRALLAERQDPTVSCHIANTLNTGHIKLKELLFFDIYRGFSQYVLDELFKIGNKNEQVPDDFVPRLVESLKCTRSVISPYDFGTLVLGLPEYKVNESLDPPTQQTEYSQYCKVLRLWIEDACATYEMLHSCLDQFSIFAGRNPKVTTTDE